MLHICLDGDGRSFFVHHESGSLEEIEDALELGAHVQALAEPHARQILARTPFARGRTEAWELIRIGESDAQPETLIAYTGSAARRRCDRAGWALVSFATLLIGGLGVRRVLRQAGAPNA